MTKHLRLHSLLLIAVVCSWAASQATTQSILTAVEFERPAFAASKFELDYWSGLIEERFPGQTCVNREGYEWPMMSEADTNVLIQSVTTQVTEKGWEVSTTHLFPESPSLVMLHVIEPPNVAFNLVAVFPADPEIGTLFIICQLQ